MSAIWLALLFIAVFWAAIFYLNRYFNLRKRGITIESGMLIWRTKRGLQFIDRVGRTLRRFWLAFGSAAAVIGFLLMAFVFIGLLLYVVIIFQHPSTTLPGAKLILPGITIPLVEGLIALFTVLIVHESAHGFVMRAQGLRTKSTGLLLWVVIPGAFVEQDEKQLGRASLMKRLRVYGAGSFANLVFAILCLGIILALISPKPGVYVYGIDVGGPAENKLWLGAQLIEIDNVPINSYEDYSNVVEGIVPGENITILTNENKLITITAAENYRDNIGILPIAATSRWEFANPLIVAAVAAEDLVGYRPTIHPYVYNSVIPWEGITILKWIFMLNFGIGLVNLLPAVPLDGGYMLRGLIEKRVKKETAKRVSYAVALFVLALIIINFFPMVLK